MAVFSPSTSVFPANFHSTDCSTLIIYHPGLVLVAGVPSGLSPTPPPETKTKKKLRSLALRPAPNLEDQVPCTYVTKLEDDPVTAPGTGFPSRHLLQLVGLRWRYSTPPPHAISPHVTVRFSRSEVIASSFVRCHPDLKLVCAGAMLLLKSVYSRPI
jgi:hypothetical protein